MIPHEILESPKQLLKTGDVLVSMTRPNLNAVALVPEQFDGAIGSTGFHVLRSRWLNPGFLLALVQTQDFIDAMSAVVQGALYPAVRPRDIAAYRLSFEAPAQQTRIVEKLEELLSDLDAGVAELKAAQKKLAQYRQSLLKAAVEGALTAEWRAQRRSPSPQPLPHQGGGALPQHSHQSEVICSPLSPRGRGAGGEGAGATATHHESPSTSVPPSTWTLQRARELRRAQTPAEAELWRQLRAKRFAGFKFRRQQPLGRYIVDFVCFEKKLIVELDGGQHAEAKDYDTARTQWLEQQGFRVLRFWNNEWTGQQEAVLETIYRALHAPLPPLPNPSPTRGEGLTAETPSTSPLALDTGEASPLSLDADEAPAPLSPGGRGAGGEGENGADLLQRILTERRARWEAKQLAKFKEKGKTPPKDWQKKYPEPVQPDTSGLPELPEGWVWASLDALIDEGPQNGLYLPGDRYGCGTPILRIDDYQIGWHRMRSELNLVDTDASTAALYALQPGDMVINRVNSMTHLGKSLSITHTLDGVLFESNMMRLRLSSELSLDYVSFYLGSHIGRARLIKDAKWAVNQASINQKDVRRTPVPLPPISEQVTIATMLQAQHGAVTSQAAAIEHALKQSTAQRQNILRAAFSGQLVPQDPNDEPASVLLERIRAEREARGAVKKPRRRNARESA